MLEVRQMRCVIVDADNFHVCCLSVGASAGAAPSLRKQVDQHGDFALIGNTLGYECDTGTPAPVVGAVGACGTNLGDSAPDVHWRSESPGSRPSPSQHRDHGGPVAQHRAAFAARWRHGHLCQAVLGGQPGRRRQPDDAGPSRVASPRQSQRIRSSRRRITPINPPPTSPHFCRQTARVPIEAAASERPASSM